MNTFELVVSGKKIVFKKELLGGDLIDIETAGMPASIQAGQNGVRLSPAESYRMRLQKLVQTVVVSFDGNEEKEFIWNAIKSLRASDYKLVMAKVDEVSQGLSEEEEKKSS